MTLVFIIFFVTLIEIPAMVLLGIWAVLQFLPALGEFIHGGGRRRSQAPSPHQAVGFELAQPLREDVLAHLRQPAVQVGVALRAEDQLPHDEQRPPLADRVQRSRDAAGVVEQPLLAHAAQGYLHNRCECS